MKPETQEAITHVMDLFEEILTQVQKRRVLRKMIKQKEYVMLTEEINLTMRILECILNSTPDEHEDNVDYLG